MTRRLDIRHGAFCDIGHLRVGYRDHIHLREDPCVCARARARICKVYVVNVHLAQ
jgi:hypothetical protein